MPKRDHEPFTIDRWRGLYSRNDMPAPPPGFMNRALNLVFSNPGIAQDEINFNSGTARVREQIEFLGVLPTIPLRFYIYKKSSGYRLMVLDILGQIWDSVAGLTVLTIAGMTDFHGITLNDHFYITPHNRSTGLNGQVVWVYDPDLGAAARKAAGDPATGTLTGVVSAVNGNVEPGLHILAVSFKTNTGFITKPALHIGVTAPDPRKKISLSVIPLGPAGTIERIIWMSHVVLNYDGNIAAIELFEAYVIENNTATSLVDTINAYDTELISSADEYAEALHEIPAGTYLTDLDGRLVVCGNYASPHTLYISIQNEPENFDAVDSLREIMKGNGTGIKTTRPIRGNLAFWKSDRTGILRVTEDTPSTWPYDSIDSGIGAEVYSVSEVQDTQDGMFYDNYLVANHTGLHVFNGAYLDILKPLSFNIETLWKGSYTINNAPVVKVIVDPLSFRVYVLIPFDNTTHWYVGNFAEGLNADSIKWSQWNFEYLGGINANYFDIHVITDANVISSGSGLLLAKEGSTDLSLLNTDTFTSGIDSDGALAAQFGIKFMDKELRDIHIDAVKMICSAKSGFNTGDYQIGVIGDHNTPFAVNFKDDVVEEKFTYTDYFPEVLVTVLGGDLNISKFITFIAIAYNERSKTK